MAYFQAPLLVFVYSADNRIAVFEVESEGADEATQISVPEFAQPFQITAAQLFDYLSE